MISLFLLFSLLLGHLMAGSVALSFWSAAFARPCLSCRRGLSSEKLRVCFFHSRCSGVTQDLHGGISFTLEGSGGPAPHFMLQTSMNGITVTLTRRAHGSTKGWRSRGHWWNWEEPALAVGTLVCCGWEVTLTSTVASGYFQKACRVDDRWLSSLIQNLI